MSRELMTVDEFVENLRKQKEQEQPAVTEPEPVPVPDFDAAEWARGLERAFLECRAMGHRWEALSARWDKESQSYYVSHQCERCETQKHSYWSRVGEPLTTTYSYPKGYLTHPGTGSAIDMTARNGLRKEYIGRIFHLNNN